MLRRHGSRPRVQVLDDVGTRLRALTSRKVDPRRRVAWRGVGTVLALDKCCGMGAMTAAPAGVAGNMQVRRALQRSEAGEGRALLVWFVGAQYIGGFPRD